MKKIIAFLLCMITVLSLNLTAFAAAESSSQLTKNAEMKSEKITASYTAADDEMVFCVNIEWKDFAVEYKEEIKEWDINELKFNVTPAEWKGTPVVTITNKSNVPVALNMSYVAPNFQDISVKWAIESYGVVEKSGEFTEWNTEGKNSDIDFSLASKADEGYESGDVPYARFSGTMQGELTETLIKNIYGEMKTSGIELGTVNVTLY